MKNSFKYLGLFLLIFFSCLIIRAQDTPEQDQKSWNFEVTPYAWLAGVSGDISFLDQSLPVDVELDEILEDLSLGIILNLEARKNRWIIFSDFIYVSLKRQARIDLLSVDASLKVKQILFELGGGYTIAEGDWYYFDGIAGLRYTGIKNTLDVDTQRLLDRNTDIFDPFLGVRFRTVSERWQTSTRLDVGGFGVGSDFSWKANLFVGYKFSRVFTLALGVQGYKVDYSKDNFGVDLTSGGLALGFNFEF